MLCLKFICLAIEIFLEYSRFLYFQYDFKLAQMSCITNIYPSFSKQNISFTSQLIADLWTCLFSSLNCRNNFFFMKMAKFIYGKSKSKNSFESRIWLNSLDLHSFFYFCTHNVDDSWYHFEDMSLQLKF